MSKGRGYPKSVEIMTQVDVDSIEEALTSNLSNRELIKLIIKLDADVQDWDFTLKLHKHFENLAKQYEKETATR